MYMYAKESWYALFVCMNQTTRYTVMRAIDILLHNSNR